MSLWRDVVMRDGGFVGRRIEHMQVYAGSRDRNNNYWLSHVVGDSAPNDSELSILERNHVAVIFQLQRQFCARSI